MERAQNRRGQEKSGQMGGKIESTPQNWRNRSDENSHRDRPTKQQKNSKSLRDPRKKAEILALTLYPDSCLLFPPFFALFATFRDFQGRERDSKDPFEYQNFALLSKMLHRQRKLTVKIITIFKYFY